jgi:hypothetical protein
MCHLTEVPLIYILQHNRKMKVENDVNVLSGEEAIDTKSDEVYIPPTLSAKRIDPEVRYSLYPNFLYAGYSCMFSFVFSPVPVIVSVTSDSENVIHMNRVCYI